jgi:predicted 2-oxoglutarate/Fe(II)-dependent dioxygenase YbiX
VAQAKGERTVQPDTDKHDVQDVAALPPASPVGHRMANFSLRDPFGQPFSLYDALEGRPALIVFLEGIEQCAALAGRANEIAGLGVDLFAIAVETPQVLAEAEAPFALFCDPDGQVTAKFEDWAFGSASPGTGEAGSFGFLLDANQRVAEARRGALEDIIAASAERLRRTRPAPAETFTSSAPVLVLPRLLDEDLCRTLVRFWVEGEPFEGTVGTVGAGDEFNRVYHEKKRRLDLAISDPGLHKQIELIIGQRIAPEFEKAFHFSNFFFERFHVVCYDAARNDFFRAHRDNLSPDTAERRFAVTVNLNDDYDGGGLVFPEYGPDQYRPDAGGVLIFSCSLIHEALPVTKGRRFALLNMARQKLA